MRTSLVAVRGLVLAVLGLGAGSALGQNVTAFNPYNGVGLPGGAPSVRGNPYTPVEQAPPNGPAFNPWNPNDVQAGQGVVPPQGVAAMPRGQLPQSDVPVATYGVPYYDRGANLPAPPPDALRSRLVAVPERGTPSTASRGRYAPPPAGTGQPVPLARTETPPPPPPAVETAPPATASTAPAPSQPAPPPPTSTQAQPTPVASTPAAPAEPAPVPTTPSAPSTPQATPEPAPTAAPAVATTAPTPAPPPAAQPQNAAAAPAATAASAEPVPATPPTPATASVLFAMDSAEINDAARTELDRVAKGANAHGLRQIELRAYAGGGDVIESRKVALARALAVRSYLIDQGVKARIEVGTFGPAAKGMGSPERVDLVAPGI